MKKMSVSFFFLLVSVHFLCDAFEDPFFAYQKNKFSKALQLYAEKKQKFASDWYMMGNAAFYKQDYFQALVFWHQSAIQGTFFYEKSVNENSNKAREKLCLENFELPLLYPFQMNEIMARFDLSFLVFFFLFGLFWVFLCLFIFSYRFNTLFIRPFLFITFIVITLFVYHKMTTFDQCYSGIIVSKTPTFIKVGPSDVYHSTKQIMPGDLVLIISQASGWYKVYYKGSYGWISDSHILTAYSAAQSYMSSENLE